MTTRRAPALLSVRAVGVAAGVRWCRGAAILCLLGALGGAAVRGADAQDAEGTGSGAATRLVVPGPQYSAGWFHRWLFGSGYRDLWTTPIRVPLLDLDSYAGGLTPLRRGGFGQTTSLHLVTADGRRFVFRSVDKDPSRGLPSLLRGTFVDDVVQDQISALHPDAALVGAPLVDAVGVLHAKPRLYVMPDTPALGEFRDQFAGMLAMLEERPDEAEGDEPGFAGSEKILNTQNFFDRLEDSPRHRVDAADFLAARLVDLFMGDRDRHSDQWRWARFPDPDGGVRWRPIPRDRDQAFFALGGVVAWLTRFWTPQFVAFGEGYPPLVWATWNGRELDRRLLVGLEKPAWDSVAAAVEARLTDSVIERAVRRMPEPHYALNGAELTRILEIRRDKLREMADAYYHLLAEHVDIHATDKNEVARLTRLDKGDVEVRLYRGRRGDRDPESWYYRRLFRWPETREIRLFMHGGEDRVVVEGESGEGILLHIVGGGNDDVLVDSSVVRGQRRRTRFYDGRGDNEFVVGSRTVVDRHEDLRDRRTERFAAPEPGDPFGVHERNWGSWWRPVVWTSAEPGVGVFLGAGAALYTYGFRRVPYEYRLTLRAGYALGVGRGRAEVVLESPSLSYRVQGHVLVRASGIEVVNFHGFGNETPERSTDRVRVKQEQYTLAPALTYRLIGPPLRAEPGTPEYGPTLSVTAGPVLTVSRTDPDDNRLVGELRPLGINTFAQLGVSGVVRYDSRNRPLAPSRGLVLEAEGALYPPVLTVTETFSKLSGEARVYLTPPGSDRWPTFAARLGVRKMFGEFPFFEAAFLGGRETLRGFREERFAGQSAVYGSGEVRVPLARYAVVVPGELGLLGFADAGRVFVEGEASGRVHVGAGGGIWLSILQRGNTVSVSVAKSRERVAVYAGAGFAF